MAKRNYLVEGLSGAGKSSVYEELIRRGYKAISTDRAWKVSVDPDADPASLTPSVWDEQRALRELENTEPDVLFVCGSSSNRDRFLRHFTQIFNLRIDDDTMRQRLRDRTNNDTGKHPDELARILALNRKDRKPHGAIDLDATKPLNKVVDEVLRTAGCEPRNSESRQPPWFKSGTDAGHSFALSVSALSHLQAAPASRNLGVGQTSDFHDVLGRESTSVVAFSWSGLVLTTLLRYLDGKGVDLLHSDHDQIASNLSHVAQASVFVLTSDHRERYLAELDPVRFDGPLLRRYYEEFNEKPAEGVEYALLDGIAFLRDALTPLESSAVAVLVIG